MLKAFDRVVSKTTKYAIPSAAEKACTKGFERRFKSKKLMDSGLELDFGTAQQGSCREREAAGMEKDTQTDRASCRLQLERCWKSTLEESSELL